MNTQQDFVSPRVDGIWVVRPVRLGDERISYRYELDGRMCLMTIEEWVDLPVVEEPRQLTADTLAPAHRCAEGALAGHRLLTLSDQQQ